MKSLLAAPGCLLIAVLLSIPSFSQERSLRFFGNGHLSPGKDRVKISLTNGSAVNVSGDFTIEFWLKCNSNENTGNVSSADHGDGWITGNVIIDRDIYGNADPGDYGLSIGAAPGLPSSYRVAAFGINRKGNGVTIQGRMNIADNKWHHIAVTRNAISGQVMLFIDGHKDAEGMGPAGNIDYPKDRATAHPESDPFLVVGAEKHDGGGAYPSYNGFIDELRISTTVRYDSDFTTLAGEFQHDAHTAALYHFDEGSGDLATDASSGADGVIFKGGEPTGPVWRDDSPFATGQSSSVKELKARKTEKGMLLSWQAENLSTPYEIQRSNDGRAFATISIVNGPPASRQSTYTDPEPFEGKNFYRIRYVSTGREKYSALAMVNVIPKTQPFKISQQGTALLVANTSPIRSLVIWNNEGKRLVEKTGIHTGTTRVDLNQNRGIAFIHITLEDGSRFTEKLMIR